MGLLYPRWQGRVTQDKYPEDCGLHEKCVNFDACANFNTWLYFPPHVIREGTRLLPNMPSYRDGILG